MTASTTLLPPPPGTCPVCATQHPDALPHNAQSVYYQYRFYGLRKRWPTWADATAHCTPEVRDQVQVILDNLKAWTEPPDGVPLIADPPGESLNQIVDMTEVMGPTLIPIEVEIGDPK